MYKSVHWVILLPVWLVFAISAKSLENEWTVFSRPGTITCLGQFKDTYWVGSQSKGLICYTSGKNGLKWFPAKRKGMPEFFDDIFFHSDSTFSLISRNAYYFFDGDSCKKSDQFINGIFNIFTDNNDMLYFTGNSIRDFKNTIFYKRDTGWVSFKNDSRSLIIHKTAVGRDNSLYSLIGNNRIVSLRKCKAEVYRNDGDSMYDTLVTIADSVKVNSLAFDTSGKLWFSTDSSQICYLSGNRIIVDSTKTARLGGKKAYSISFDKLNRMWIVSSYSILCCNDTGWMVFDQSNTSFLKNYSWKFATTTSSTISMKIEPLMKKNNQGYISFVVNDQIVWFDSSSTWNILSPDSLDMLPTALLTGFHFDSKDTGWLVGTDYSSVYKYFDGNFIPCNWDTAGKSVTIRSFYIDKTDNFRFLTNTGSVYKYDKKNWREIKPGSTIYPSVDMSEDSKGNIWFAGYDKSNNYCLYKTENDSIRQVYTNQTIPILEYSVSSLICTPDDRTLFGTSKGHIGIIERDSFYIYSRLKAHLPGSPVTFLFPIENNRFWIGSGSYLIEFDQDVKRYLEYGKPGGIPVPYIKCALKREDGKLWIAGPKQLFVFDGATSWERTSEDSIHYNSSANTINSMVSDRIGNIWLTYPDALVRYTPPPQIPVFTIKKQKTLSDVFHDGNVSLSVRSGILMLNVTASEAADVTLSIYQLNGTKVMEKSTHLVQGVSRSIPLVSGSGLRYADNLYIANVRMISKGKETVRVVPLLKK